MTSLIAYFDHCVPPPGSPPLKMLDAAVAPPATDRQKQREAEERWNQWIAKGVRQDEAMARRFKWAACVIILGLIMWMLLTM